MIAITRDDFRMPALHLQEAPGSDYQHPRHLQGEERSGEERSRAARRRRQRARTAAAAAGAAFSGGEV